MPEIGADSNIAIAEGLRVRVPAVSAVVDHCTTIRSVARPALSRSERIP